MSILVHYVNVDWDLKLGLVAVALRPTALKVC